MATWKVTSIVVTAVVLTACAAGSSEADRGADGAPSGAAGAAGAHVGGSHAAGGGLGTGGGSAGSGPQHLAWDGPVPIDLSPITTEGAFYPRLATDSQGRIHLVWSNSTEFRTVGVPDHLGDPIAVWAGQLFHAVDYGAGFTDAQGMVDDEAQSLVEGRWSRHDLAIDGADRLHVVWGWPSPTEGLKILYTRRDASGGWVQPPQLLADNPDNVFGPPECNYFCCTGVPRIGASGNDALWTVYDRSVYTQGSFAWHEHFRSSTDGGASWPHSGAVAGPHVDSLLGLGGDQVWAVGVGYAWDNGIQQSVSYLHERTGSPAGFGSDATIAGQGTGHGLRAELAIYEQPVLAVSPTGERRIAWFHWIPTSADDCPCKGFPPDPFGDAGCAYGPFTTRDEGNGWEPVAQVDTGRDITGEHFDVEEEGAPLAMKADASGTWYLAWRYLGDTKLYVAVDTGDGWSTPQEIGQADGFVDMTVLPGGHGVRVVWSALVEASLDERDHRLWQADLFLSTQ